MIPRPVAAAAALVLVGAACEYDGPDGPGVFGGPVSAATCTPIPGYEFPVTDHGGEAPDGPPFAIVAEDSFFDPTCVLEATSGMVTLQVTNNGSLLHNVSVADQGIDVDVAQGETIDVTVEVGSEPLVFVCKYHRTSGMVGALLPGDA